MKILNSLSIPFYEFHCDPNLLDEIKVRVENLNYITDENKEAEFSKNYFYYEPLINWFDECLEQVRKIYYNDNIKLEVVNCWATRTGFLKKLHTHAHQQSLVGGIFYLDTFTSGETVFYQSNPWQDYTTNNIVNIAAKQKVMATQLVTKILPEKGKLVLYPPQLRHGTLPNKEKKVRYSIAFDSYFSGRITDNSHWPYVEIKTTSLREIASKDLKL
jgi:hypothetical protein